jgi:hypothetical protein
VGLWVRGAYAGELRMSRRDSVLFTAALMDLPSDPKLALKHIRASEKVAKKMRRSA